MNWTTKRIALSTLGIAGAGMVFGVTAFFAFELAARWRSTSQQLPAATSVAGSSSMTVRSPTKPSSQVPSMRNLVRMAIDQAPVKQPSELKAYLNQLEEQARRRGEVTALDVEPGISMIREHGDAQQAETFSERMLALQRALKGARSEPPRDPLEVPRHLDQLLPKIQNGSGTDRQDLVREFLEATYRLPDEMQGARIAQLNQVAGESRIPVSAASLDSLRKDIDGAPDEEARQDLIRDYLEVVQALPDGHEPLLLEEFNRRYGSRADAAPTEVVN